MDILISGLERCLGSKLVPSACSTFEVVPSLRFFVCGSGNITKSLTWNWELVGERFREVANQPMQLLRNYMRAEHATMKSEICNVEMWTCDVGMPTGPLSSSLHMISFNYRVLAAKVACNIASSPQGSGL